MVVIEGLKQAPVRKKHTDYTGHEYGCQCPCYVEANRDGPAYCTILALMNLGWQQEDPDNHECPLKNYKEQSIQIL